MMGIAKDIKAWMRANVCRFIIDERDEINHIVLAEMLAEAWDLEQGAGKVTGTVTLDDDHIAWSIALEVAEKYKKTANKSDHNMIDMVVITDETRQRAMLAFHMVNRGFENVRTIHECADVAAHELALFSGYNETFVTTRARDQFISNITDYLIRENRNSFRTKPSGQW